MYGSHINMQLQFPQNSGIAIWLHENNLKVEISVVLPWNLVSFDMRYGANDKHFCWYPHSIACGTDGL